MVAPQLASAKVDPDVDLQGKLSVFSLSDLFQMLSFTRKTGTVTLIQGWNSRTITFEDGRVSYVAAGSRLPTMVELLHRNGKVDREQMETLKQSRARSSAEMIEQLRSAGAITAEDLQTCREQLLELSIYTLFLWRNCYFTFKAGEVVREGGVAVDVDSMQIIIEGTRRVDEWIEVSPVVPSVYMIFRTRKDRPLESPPGDLTLTLNLIDGTRDVFAISRRLGFTQFQTARALYELVQRGYIEAVPRTS